VACGSERVGSIVMRNGSHPADGRRILSSSMYKLRNAETLTLIAVLSAEIGRAPTGAWTQRTKAGNQREGGGEMREGERDGGRGKGRGRGEVRLH